MWFMAMLWLKKLLQRQEEGKAPLSAGNENKSSSFDNTEDPSKINEIGDVKESVSNW